MRKVELFGVQYSVTNYLEATDRIIYNAKRNKSFSVSALAVHGLIEAYRNPKLRNDINSIHMVVPDGQPIRWAINIFYSAALNDRVCGPKLTEYILERANRDGLRVFLYGSTKDTLGKFMICIKKKFPNIIICGAHIDRFRDATNEEDDSDISKINASRANIVLVGRGCPRQEIWVANHIDRINAAMIAVGAAFDFHAGTMRQAPEWMQRFGLEWLFRLFKEPKRLWKRYIITNSLFLWLTFKRFLIFRRQ